MYINVKCHLSNNFMFYLLFCLDFDYLELNYVSQSLFYEILIYKSIKFQKL